MKINIDDARVLGRFLADMDTHLIGKLAFDLYIGDGLVCYKDSYAVVREFGRDSDVIVIDFADPACDGFKLLDKKYLDDGTIREVTADEKMDFLNLVTSLNDD